MIKKILLGIFLGVLIADFDGFEAIAEEPPPTPKKFFAMLHCTERTDLFDTIKNADEELLIDGVGFLQSANSGRSYPGRFGLFVNQDTGTFSAVVLFNDLTACLLFPGSSFLPYTGKQPWELLEERDKIFQ